MIDYGFTKEFDIPFEDAIELATSRLKIEGFGILTKIDIKQKLKEKLGIDFRKYVILGACHPASAHKAILAEPDIGLMLPCNVIIYEKGGSVIVAAIKPTVAMAMIDNPPLGTIAAEVETRIKGVIDSLR